MTRCAERGGTRDERLAADARARRRAALHFGDHMILEAGAGTGKTTVLVSRFLVWCLGPGYDACADAPDELRGARVFETIAALTFSEAAAAEMETRIAQGLREVAAGRAPIGLGEADLAPWPDCATRAGALLDHGERMQVSTIHSFCRRILAAYPVEAGVAHPVRIDASGRAAAAAARRVLEDLLDDPSAAEWDDLGALAERGCGPAELEALLTALLMGPVRPEDFPADPLSPEALAMWWARVRTELARLDPAAAARPPRNPAELATWVDDLRARWPDSARRALRRDRDRAPLVPLLEHCLGIEPDTLLRIHRTLAPRLRAARIALRRDGVLSFDDLLRDTRDLLERSAGVRAAVASTLRQLLVDEFQDTDRIQCEIVSALGFASDGPRLFVVGDPKQSIYAWRSADLRSYDGFLARLAEAGAERHQLRVSYRAVPALLSEVDTVFSEAMNEDPGIQPAFRSLAACEALRRLGEQEPDRERVAYWVAEEVDERGAPRRTRNAESLQLETRALVDDLWAVHGSGEVPWSESAILLRSTGDLDDVLDALRRAQIPYAVDRDRIYFRRREVQEARALLRLLIDPNDDLAWVATLRSARFGVPDAAWVPLCRAGGLDALRRALAGDAEGVRDFAATLRDTADAIAEARVPGLRALHEAGWADVTLSGVDTLVALRASFARDPFDLFLARARRASLLDVSEGARFLGAYRLANLDRFFREIDELYVRTGGDLASVLRELRREDVPLPETEEGRPPTAGRDAVQVMTIHGAKGLDFTQVYLLQAHRTRARRGDDPFSCEWIEHHWETQLRFGRRRNEAVSTLGWDLAAAHRDAVEAAEQVRTLYVAMTRAKRRLVVSGRLASAGAVPPRSHADLLATRVAAVLAADPGAAGVTRRVLGAEGTSGERAHATGAARAAVTARPAAPSRSVFAPERARAERYASRPFGLAASAAVSRAARHYEDAEADGSASAEPATGHPARRGASPHAAAIGSAIHAYLEVYRFADGTEPQTAEPSEATAREALCARLANRVPEEDRELAMSDALDVLERFRASPLWAHFARIQPAVLGREVSLLAPPAPEGPGGVDDPSAYSIGAVDLLHRDEESGEVVVVDFKSDDVDEDEVAARAHHYAPQGRVYCDAVASALDLDRRPRFELWFLAAGRRVVVDPALPAREASDAHFSRAHPPT